MKKHLLCIAIAISCATMIMAQAHEQETDTVAAESNNLTDLVNLNQNWVIDGDKVYLESSTAKVGIRTSNPLEALHINGYIRGEGPGGALRINTDYGITCIGAVSGNYSHFNTTKPRFYFYKPIMIEGGQISSSNGTNLYFQTFLYDGSSLNPTTRMTILNSNGNVGIGTTTPAYKLDVNGNMRAAHIYAEEITVSIPAGADFVFDAGYELRPLKDLQQYIQNNKHLPEIQSEQDMQENGVNVQQFQIQLLQKIEELTLYIIKQDERIKELEAKSEK